MWDLRVSADKLRKGKGLAVNSVGSASSVDMFSQSLHGDLRYEMKDGLKLSICSDYAKF